MRVIPCGPLVSLCASAILLGPVPAQGSPTLQVTAHTQLTYSAGSQTTTVPQGQNLTAGSSFAVGVAFASASHLLQTGTSGESLSVRVDERCSVFNGSAAFGPHEFQMEYRTAAPEPALVDVSGDAYLGFGLGSTAQGFVSFTISGIPTPWNFAPLGGPFHFSQAVTVDASGVRVRLRSSGSAGAGGGAPALMVSDWTVLLSPDPGIPCTIQANGTGCGAELTAKKTWGSPDSYLLSIEPIGPGPTPLLGAFALGTHPITVPLPGGCVLTNNASFVAVVGVNAAGLVEGRLLPPPIPGFQFEAQGLLLRADGSVSASEGLSFTRN